MNITRGHKLLGSLILAVGLLVSTGIEAAHGGGGGHGGGGWGGHGGGWGHGGGGWGGHGWGGRGGGWIGPGYGVFIGPNYPYYNNCAWVPGHWEEGYWIPPQRICS
jgi:hypothetical protein